MWGRSFQWAGTTKEKAHSKEKWRGGKANWSCFLPLGGVYLVEKMWEAYDKEKYGEI